ncbi:hypothetical protein E0Z10_g6890 [Xylaria hypoxylon]|uniref:Uncharacterized protein n=1 Tax=Xylaria hypoxylon TaxID=37992 RepID=A0A4Z0YTU8_9PEZI|nr:hypothetical protein E0Z10_g6890 [Xylaria hypoxylon]
MRLALLISALSAIATSAAIPRNTTAAISNSTAESPPHETPDSQRHIPVEMKKCMGHNLSEEYYLGAKENMVTWAYEKKITPTNLHAEHYPDNRHGVTWYICNCKIIFADEVPAWELDEVQQILAAECGEWQSGWVWSKKWQKGYNVVPTDWYMDKVEKLENLCPPGCLPFRAFPKPSKGN